MRTSPDAKGQDIFGGGNWEQSKLYEVLYVNKTEPLGRPPSLPAEGPIIFAGFPVQTTAELATPTQAATSNDQVARPSNPGGPGEEGTQGVPNPGTDDGSVPALNPIDSTMVSSDYKTFAYNIDLFVQHGSTPAGPNPSIFMPPWGDQNALTQQQIADVIAYVISLNK